MSIKKNFIFFILFFIFIFVISSSCQINDKKDNYLFKSSSDQKSFDENIEHKSSSDQKSLGVIKNNNNQPFADLIGKITDQNKNPLKGVKVSLLTNYPKKQKANLILKIKTNKDGEYKFEQISPGIYYLEVKKNNYQTKVQEIKIVKNRTITFHVTLYDVCESEGKVPILLVPGVMGSFSKEKSYFLWPYPRLSSTSPAWDSGELELLDPFGYIGWVGLIEKLKKHGYSKGCTIFPVPYDWSLSLPIARDKYLIPWINKAKEITKSDKVDIIAHSMGGLLARSYIQSDLYKNDVRKFALVGTPNQGANNMYYIWEGGDPIYADIVTKDTGIFNPTAYFYTNTVSYFYYDRYGVYPCKFEEFRRYKPYYCDNNKIYEAARLISLASGQIMPIFESALQNINNETIPIIKEENTFLKALNNIKCFNPKGCVDSNGEIYSYKNPKNIFTPDKSGVETMFFVGEQEETTDTIIVETSPNNRTFYQDGMPKNLIQNPSGDGTVTTKSVIWDENLLLKNITKPACHSYLIKTFTPELVKFITEKDIHDLMTKESKKILGINIEGRIQIAKITDFDNNLLNTDIAQQEHKINSSNWSLENPKDGNYRVLLYSPYHENYEISIIYFDENGKNFFAQKYLGYFDYSLKTFSFTIDSKNLESPIIFDRAFNTPAKLKISKKDNKIRLSWRDINQDVKYYEIFWKGPKNNHLHYLDKVELKNSDENREANLTNEKKTIKTTYLTNHAWENSVTNMYAVRAILKDNSSTFLSQPTILLRK